MKRNEYLFYLSSMKLLVIFWIIFLLFVMFTLIILLIHQATSTEFYMDTDCHDVDGRKINELTCTKTLYCHGFPPMFDNEECLYINIKGGAPWTT